MNNAIIDPINARLDELEESLPPLPARILRADRKLVEIMVNTTATLFCGVNKTAMKLFGMEEPTPERVRSVVNEGVSDAKTDLSKAGDDVEDVTVDAVTPADPDRGYETWTKDELYERAQELDIEGRSTLTKTQLITALRDAS